MRGEVGENISSLLLALLLCLEGEAGMLKPLDGLAKGLVGRSDVWLICERRRTNGLVFSGDRDPAFIGDSPPLGFVGDCVGVVARTVAGEALFWRLKGDWRPESKESGEGRRGLAWRHKLAVFIVRSPHTYHSGSRCCMLTRCCRGRISLLF
jgi:hypothetical protein